MIINQLDLQKHQLYYWNLVFITMIHWTFQSIPKEHNISLLPSFRTNDDTSDDECKQQPYDNIDDTHSISSWTIQTTATDDRVQYNNTWNVFSDEYCNNVELPFEIFGTSADNASAMPHVLSPPLMDSLRNFLPDRLFHQNYWLKYSLVRDGADLQTLQRKVKSSQYTLLAIETTTGHVFGCFTSTPWRKSNTYFGNGESFVWKMKKTAVSMKKMVNFVIVLLIKLRWRVKLKSLLIMVRMI